MAKVIDILSTDFGDQDVAGWRYEAFAQLDTGRGIGGVVGYSDGSPEEAKVQLRLLLQALEISFTEESFSASDPDEADYEPPADWRESRLKIIEGGRFREVDGLIADHPE